MQQADQGREDDERHHARLQQRDVVADRGHAGLEVKAAVLRLYRAGQIRGLARC
jgi:hypothetical protein